MDTIKIAHVSDPHFGSPRQLPVWQSLRNYLNDTTRPHLVLVTGDIVHTPRRRLYRQAQEELRQLRVVGPNPGPNDAYRVCAGNHDRHPKGVAPGRLAKISRMIAGWAGSPSWFDNVFAGLIPTVGNPLDFHLAVNTNSWKVRVIGCDTSAAAKYTAQGFATAADLEGLADAARGDQDTDLVILMHHHHLLSIKELEDSRQRLRSLFKPTIMLNAGTVLEALAQGHVNLVLHGHEHHRAYARYGTVRGQQSDTVIVGAGSATGNDSYEGCDFRRASFNVIELRRDRSVYVQEIGHDGIRWNPVGAMVPLLDGRAIRRARFYRRTNPASPPTSKIMACFDFQSDRIINVTRTWTDWTLEGGRWTYATSNSSGVPSHAHVKFDWPQGELEEFESEPLVADSRRDTYRLDVQSRRGMLSLARRITIQFQWLGGAVLTKDDLDYFDPTKLGKFRSRGREFAAISAHNEVQSLSLMVRLPPLFAPRPEDIEVFYEKPEVEDNNTEAIPELAEALQHHSAGVFSLEVPYPRRGYRYVLTWPVLEGLSPSTAAGRFRTLASDKHNAQKLLQSFVELLGRSPVTSAISIGLYVPTRNVTILKRVGQLCRGAEESNWEVPTSLSLQNGNTLYRHAWWGQIQLAVPDTHNGDATFMPGERGVAVVPIRQFGREADVSWGLVRVGIYANAELSDTSLLELLVQHEAVEELADGVLRVLQEAMELDRDTPCV